jgi:hypothetical protein
VKDLLEVTSTVYNSNSLATAVLRHHVAVLSEDYLLPEFLKESYVATKTFVADVRKWVTNFIDTLNEQEQEVTVPLSLRVEIQDIDKKLYERMNIFKNK